MRLALFVLTFAAAPLLAGTKNDLDAFARKAMDLLGAPPGMTVVVVRDDRVIYRGDFGLRDVEARLPVTPDTRFYLASSTKAFTAMAALVLAEEGRIDLDAPVTTYWPAVKLTPPLDAERLSLRDLLAMRPGLQNDTYNYRAAIGNIGDGAELLRILATYSKARPRTFHYSNMSYELAAEVLERAAGRSWQELTQEKVFAPLGMSTATSFVPQGDVAVARLYVSTAPGVFRRTQGKSDATMGPAGGTFMTSNDAARWIVAMLHDGRLDGRQALPKRAVRLAQSAQTTQKRSFRWFNRWGWGLGQDLADYDGELLVHRFGGFNGAYSHISWMPERRIGVAVLSNGGGAAADAMAAYAYDLLLGKKDLDAKWTAELAKLAADAKKAREEMAGAASQPHGAPALPLERYAGAYHSARLGRIDVAVEEQRLIARHGVLRAELIPAGGDAFRIDWLDEGDFAALTFLVDPAGRITGFDWGGRPFERVE